MRDIDSLVEFISMITRRKLELNEPKKHWSTCSYQYLIKRLREEVDELEYAIMHQTPLDAIEETADVINFAAFIADNMRSHRITTQSKAAFTTCKHGVDWHEHCIKCEAEEADSNPETLSGGFPYCFFAKPSNDTNGGYGGGQDPDGPDGQDDNDQSSGSTWNETSDH